jgi:hypothetical protein
VLVDGGGGRVFSGVPFGDPGQGGYFHGFTAHRHASGAQLGVGNQILDAVDAAVGGLCGHQTVDQVGAGQAGENGRHLAV